MGVPSQDEFDRTCNWLHQKVRGVRRARYLGGARFSEGVLGMGDHCTHSLLYSLLTLLRGLALLTCTYACARACACAQVLGAELEWVRELLRYCTGRATLRAYDSPAHYFEDDKDGVKAREYTMVHMHTYVRAYA